MNYLIAIKVYPLLGAWRAECLTCGAYATSDINTSALTHRPIGQALDMLAITATTECWHDHSSPDVQCQIEYGSLDKLNEPFDNPPYTVIDTGYNQNRLFEVVNDPKDKWQQEFEEDMKDLEKAVSSPIAIVDNKVKIKTLLICAAWLIGIAALLWIIVSGVMTVGGIIVFVNKLGDACNYRLCL